ncbi:class I SAM-dependent methyltransferase [Paenibacillus flagellatus]|nr:methyltransferase [Paenibacillus flagellatus]
MSYVNDKTMVFDDPHYNAITAARLGHLASLQLPIYGKSVVDLGCGIGRLSEFFALHGCNVLGLDGREDNIAQFRSFYPHLRAEVADLEGEDWLNYGKFDIVFCYGLLYHLADPFRFIRNAYQACGEMMLIETCITPSSEMICKLVAENSLDNSQALHAVGNRPSPSYVAFCLKRSGFAHVYTPIHKPMHSQFHGEGQWGLIRDIFIATKTPLANDKLSLIE